MQLRLPAGDRLRRRDTDYSYTDFYTDYR